MPDALIRWMAGALAVLALLAGIWWHGHSRGAAGVQAEWDADRARLNTKLLAQERSVRAAEQQHAQALAAIDAKYQENERNAQLETDRLRAQLRAGTVRLSVPVVAGSCRLPATGAGAGSGDGAERADIQPAAADDLVALAADADAVVRQLSACQAVVRADRFIADGSASAG